MSALLLISAVGVLVAGRKITGRYKALLWVPMVALLIIRAATPTIFWPLIQDLVWVRSGRIPMGPDAASALAMKWIVLDWLRTAFIALGFVASVQAIGITPR